MNIKRKISFVLLFLMVMSLCCGCGSQSIGTKSYYASETAYDSYGDYDDYAMVSEEAVNSLGFAPASAAGSTMASKRAPEPQPAETESEYDVSEPQNDDSEFVDKIIYSADVTVETTAFDDSIKNVPAMIKGVGGYIESSSVSDANYYNTSRGIKSNRSAQYTIRVPSQKFESVLQTMHSIGNVPYSHVYTDNVTAQYYDTQARLKVYQAQEKRLIEMLEIAETVEDIITIEDKLTDVRYEIESMQSMLKNWDRKVSYSTIYLTLSEVQEYTPEQIVNPTFGEELVESIKYGWKSALTFVENLIIWLVENLPVMAILGIIVFVVIKILKRIFKNRKINRFKKNKKLTGAHDAQERQADHNSLEKEDAR